jgi:hypothetical protein
MIHFSVVNILNIINAFFKKASYEGGCTKNVFVQALLLSPRAYFLSPRAKRGVAPVDGVPNEVRDASLSLGRTK